MASYVETHPQPSPTGGGSRVTYTYTTVETEAGWVPIAGRDGKISALRVPAPTRDEAIASLQAGIDGQLVECSDGYIELARQVQKYFAGEKTGFSFEPDLAGLTEFQQKILKTTMSIPYGSIASYRWVADQSGHPGAYRAAGQALSRNPIAVAIPCHRVVASGGRLGGFTGGVHWKIRMLKMEGVEL